LKTVRARNGKQPNLVTSWFC